MKIKNLFKSLMVVALIVPFAFGLAACGDKDKAGYKSIAASEAYNSWVELTAVMNMPPEEQGRKVTYIDTVKDDDVVKKSILGIDSLGDEPANNYFYLEYEGDTLTHHEFTATTGEPAEKNIYKYLKEGGWQQPTTFVDEQFETYVGEYENSFLDLMETLGLFLPAETEAEQEPKVYEDFESYSATFDQRVAGLFDGLKEESDVLSAFEGRKYKDGSIGFVVKFTVITTDDATITSSYEFVMKDDALTRIVIDSTRTEISGTTQTHYQERLISADYLSSEYVPTDLSKCVPAED